MGYGSTTPVEVCCFIDDLFIMEIVLLRVAAVSQYTVKKIKVARQVAENIYIYKLNKNKKILNCKLKLLSLIKKSIRDCKGLDEVI